MISVYGSTGFVGSQFCAQYPDEVCPIPRDQRNPESDNILYLISTTHNYNVFEDPQRDIDTNLKVLVEVLAACRDRSVTVNFVSSWFVYGETELPAREDAVCQPRGFYSITKKAAEDLLISYCQTFGMVYRIFRLANVIGPGDQFSKKKNALQFVAEQLRLHEPVDLYHGGDFYRDYLHVDDVCRAMRLLMDKAPLNTIFNVGRGENLKFRDLIDQLISLTGSRSELRAIDPPEFHRTVQVKDMYLDVARLTQLGFAPQISVNDALASIVAPEAEEVAGG